MPDDPANPPAGTPPATPPANPPALSQEEFVKQAEQLGVYKKKSEDFDDFQKRVNPVLETIWSDPELYNTVLEKHNKRLGIVTDPKGGKKDDDDDDDDAGKGTPSAAENENRQFLVNQAINTFEKDSGLDKLSPEARKGVNERIFMELKDMLDPMDNKTIMQVLAEVSLKKLPRYLEKAYTLATKDDQIKAAMEAGKKSLDDDGTGIIGSMPSGSVNIDQVTLTAKEKEIARRMNVPEEKYLENKKKKLKEQNS